MLEIHPPPTTATTQAGAQYEIYSIPKEHECSSLTMILGAKSMAMIFIMTQTPSFL